MKKTILIAFLMLALSNLTSAKTNDSSANTHKYPTTGYISINDGYGFPMGKFASVSGYGNGAGYAKEGKYASVDFGMPIKHSNYGITASIGYYNNPFDNISYTSNNAGFLDNFQYANYSEGTIMAGLYATYPHKHFSYDFKVLAGAAICNYPSFVYSGFNSLSSMIYSQISSGTSANATSFAYMAAFTLRYYPIKGHLFVSLQASYFGTNASFNTTQSTNMYSETVRITQPYSIVGIIGGIGLKF